MAEKTYTPVDDKDSSNDEDELTDFTNDDQDWSCPVAEESSESSGSDDEDNPDMQSRNRIRYVFIF